MAPAAGIVNTHSRSTDDKEATVHNRRIVLKAEHLSELTADDLGGVVAGAPPQPTEDCPDYTYYCITGYALCGDLTRPFC